MSYPAISLATATVGRHRCPQKRLQTAPQPPGYQNSSPDHRACNSLTPFRCPHAVHPCPIGGFGLGPSVTARSGGDLPPRDWARLEAAYEERSADVYELGRKLGAIMERVGWGTRQQALEAMISARDTLGLKVDDRVLVIEPVSGKVF